MNKELKLLLKLQNKVEGVQSSPGVGVRVDANDENAKQKKKKKGLNGVLFWGGWKN